MTFELKTIWEAGSTVGPRYVKYDNSGSLINPDKFKNYRNYYWTGVTLNSEDLPAYNAAGLPEYSVIESGGSSDWSTYNFWTHISRLNKADLHKYVQAIKPIIEFNKKLENQLLATKVAFGQLPKFRHYRRQGDTLYLYNDGGIPELTTDLYAQEHLLTEIQESTVAHDHLLLGQTFEFAGRRYIQGLYSGYYVDGVYTPINLYVILDGAPRTLRSAPEILDESNSARVINGSVENGDGVWDLPPQLLWNVQNETRSEIKQGDLYFHLVSIINAQRGLTGSSTGNNNWRNLSEIDLGTAGKIKQFDGNTALLISNLLQEGISHLSLLDFAKQSYRALTVSIKTFIEDELPTLIVNGEINPGTTLVNDELLARFKNYLGLNSIFTDTTSSLANVVITLPYMGLVEPVSPKVELDHELNMLMMVHHDGHKTEIPIIDTDTLKRLVQKKFLRSSGVETAGTVTGFSLPQKPYRGQFWYKTSTKQLFFFDVLSDTGELPTTAQLNDYSYDRQTDNVWQFNGATWILLGNTVTELALPFREMNLESALADLTLAIETELFEGCPPLQPRVNVALLEAKDSYHPLMKKELEGFGVYYGVADVYSTVFDPENSFTWNFSSAFGVATWHQVYEKTYGTTRPDLEPWIPAGYATEDELLTDLIRELLIPEGTTSWDYTLWASCSEFLRIRYVINGVGSRLAVDVSTGALLPPYVAHSEALVTTPPASASNSFAYGDMAPVELFWTRTLDYLYSKQKTYFRLNPLEYVNSTWGIYNAKVGTYTLNAQFGKKIKAAELQHHGDPLSTGLSESQLEVQVHTAPSSNQVYTITCVSRMDNIFKLEGGELTSPRFFVKTTTTTYAYINPYEDVRGFFWGDKFTVTVKPDLTASVVVASSQSYLKSEGFNQLYTQYLRAYGQDDQTSLNRSLFNDWEVKLGYRFNTLINTDLLRVKGNDEIIPKLAYDVSIKENRFVKSTWLNALKVTLAQRGSSERVGNIYVPGGAQPGDDWVFRIDNFNPQRTTLSWYSYDLSGKTNTFRALDGKATMYGWTRPLEKTTLNTFKAPFLITGIQNLANFIFGFEDKLVEDGWRFNDQENQVLDAETGRPINYQLLVEKFIVQQFSGVTTGSEFIFNPFHRKVWFETPRGVVTGLSEILGMETETVPKLLTSDQRQVPLNKVRVFRQDALTEFVFDEPVFTFHLLTSEYEHIVLFNNYPNSKILFYDAFLGQAIDNIFFEGRMQEEPTGRLDFGGHFLVGGEMKRNLESSVGGISKLYETANTISALPEVERARAAIGFQHKSYFDTRKTSDQTEFRFWQGMIGHKGTNFAVDAFINSTKYSTALLDEYWAYRIADYGDARRGESPELKIYLEDVKSRQRTPYLFTEADDATSEIEESLDDGSLVTIESSDEARWFSYEDVNSLKYIELELIAEQLITPTTLNELITIVDSDNKPILANCFELVNPLTNEVFYEHGQLVVGSQTIISETLLASQYGAAPYAAEPISGPFSSVAILEESTGELVYSPPKFSRERNSTLQILDGSLIGVTLKVKAYGPPLAAYSPSQLYDYTRNIQVKDDLTWWDPARGRHHSLAVSQVDYVGSDNPAVYTVTNTYRANQAKPWGSSEIGKIWWNISDLDYQPYSDTKVYPEMNQRLDRWGSIAEYSKVETYEWIMSDVPPSEYKGELAVDRLVYRTRAWQQRPVAWRYSSNPSSNPRQFLAYQPSELFIDGNTITIKTGSFEDLGFDIGTKISGAVYSAASKNDTELVRIFGTAQVNSSPIKVLGSATSLAGGPQFVASTLFSFSAEIDDGVISYRDNAYGQYVLGYEVENTIYYLTLKHVESGEFQRLVVKDTPVTAGTKDSYSFDQLGVKLYYTPVYGQSDSWNGSPSTSGSRIQALATALGSSAHQIFIRSQVEVLTHIPFVDGSTTYTTLKDDASVDTVGWIAWNDPTTNPLHVEMSSFEPIVGSWVNVDSRLADLATDIENKLADSWVGLDGSSYVPYRATWSSWVTHEAEKRKALYDTLKTTHQEIFANEFTFDLTASQLRDRASAYVNGVKVQPSVYTVEDTVDGATLTINESILTLGDMIVVIVRAADVTPEQLEFDPTVNDDPMVSRQYRRDQPYVLEERRGSGDSRSIKNYFFWVKNKELAPSSKRMSVKQVSTLLTRHDDSYCVPQVVKYANQLDGRPNRFAVISVEELGRYVDQDDTYKLRIKYKPYLRQDDRNANLKNIHEEWILIRPYQPHKIPKKLWDMATDAVSGVNMIGEALPHHSLILYDSHNGTSTKYGPRRGQILTETTAAREIVKHTILNTKVAQYLNGELILDYINYHGFDINTLDARLATSASARQLMSELWLFAKPKQINEIFFGLLEDGIARNLEMPDFFKTSYVAINDIRTVEFQTDTFSDLDLRLITLDIAQAVTESVSATDQSTFVERLSAEEQLTSTDSVSGVITSTTGNELAVATNQSDAKFGFMVPRDESGTITDTSDRWVNYPVSNVESSSILSSEDATIVQA